MKIIAGILKSEFRRIFEFYVPNEKQQRVGPRVQDQVAAEAAFNRLFESSGTWFGEQSATASHVLTSLTCHDKVAAGR